MLSLLACLHTANNNLPYYLRSEDMLAILFPHLFEDVEYLLEPEDLGASTHEQALLRFAQGSINATPGPSKQG